MCKPEIAYNGGWDNCYLKFIQQVPKIKLSTYISTMILAAFFEFSKNSKKEVSAPSVSSDYMLGYMLNNSSLFQKVYESVFKKYTFVWGYVCEIQKYKIFSTSSTFFVLSKIKFTCTQNILTFHLPRKSRTVT